MNKAKILSIVLIVSILVYLGIKRLNDDEHKSGYVNQQQNHKTNTVKTEQLVEGSSEVRKRESNANNHFRKSLDDDWCNAEVELTSDDFDLVKSEESEWDNFIGKATVSPNGMSYNEDEFYPDNYNIAPYQELPIEELERQAIAGDKWAMVAYVQLAGFHRRDKAREIANELILLGAVHHGVEFLVLSELATARSNARRERIDKSEENIINAIAYTLIGLKSYSDSGVIAYLSNVTKIEVFQDILNPSILLAGKQEVIKNRYDELKTSIETQREMRSIFVKQAPELIKKSFTHKLSLASFRRKEQLQLIHDLMIIPELDFREDSCYERTNARLADILKG